MKTLINKEPLGGGIGESNGYNAKKEIKELGLTAEETITIKNPITGKVTDVVISRDGTHEEKVIRALASKDMTREQKDNVLSMYLFERGKDSASFLMDLFASKGTHTKETRAFKSQVRFDLTLMANSLAVFFNECHDQIYRDLEDDVSLALQNLADRFKSMSEKLVEQVSKTTEDRMKEKGYGIYIDGKGKPYSIFDEDFDRVIEKDKEELADKEK